MSNFLLATLTKRFDSRKSKPACAYNRRVAFISSGALESAQAGSLCYDRSDSLGLTVYVQAPTLNRLCIQYLVPTDLLPNTIQTMNFVKVKLRWQKPSRAPSSTVIICA